MVMKQLAALAGVVAPAAAVGLKFSSKDLKSEKSLWQLYSWT